jgi:hypothetical protein
MVMSKEKTRTVFIIVAETPLKSWLRDLSAYAFVVGVIGTGVLLESSAMQWVGFCAVVLTAGARVRSRSFRTRTIKEVLQELDRMDREGFRSTRI